MYKVVCVLISATYLAIAARQLMRHLILLNLTQFYINLVALITTT